MKFLTMLLSVAVFAGLCYGIYTIVTGSGQGASSPSRTATVSTAGLSDEAIVVKDTSAPASSSLSSSSSDAQEASASSSSNQEEGFPIGVIAECNGALLHSPIRPADLEGVLFHQASYHTALPMTSQLPEADVAAMEENPDYAIAEEQPTGDEWINARALHLWRDDTPTDMDTSIDVGAEAGTTVYAPVSGTVVLVCTYNLYDVVEDYELHIQPDGRPDLDVVLIHISDLEVKQGDKVAGGVTPVAHVRDLAAADITDIQLASYSKERHGNHTHVQVNNANDPEYRETRLKDATKVE
ncbi:MAG: hypothetical protein IJ131_09670 [Eggerthellaceae bacterium]|nr:hypothetical protein [Eggerthellaceae bacterium]